MDAPTFVCPMCCNETFADVDALRYHLLSLTVNLFCPICDTQVDDLPTLVEHLSDKHASMAIDQTELNEFYDATDQDALAYGLHVELTAHDEQSLIDENVQSNASENGFSPVRLNDTTDAPTKANQRTAVIEWFLELEKGILQKLDETQRGFTYGARDALGRNIIKMYTCARCRMSFEQSTKFYKHRCDVDGVTVYACDACGERKQTKRALDVHMKTHAHASPHATPNDEENIFVCLKCDTRFPTHKSLLLHKRMHKPIQPRDVHAPINCDLNGPKADEETHAEQFTCAQCHLTCDKRYEHVHLQTHQTDAFTCAICNRKFESATSLEMHRRVHKTARRKTPRVIAASTKSYTCRFCDSKFLRPHEKVHHERVHTGEKPYACTICNKRFRVNFSLTIHMRIHTGERPYKCTQCAKHFKSYGAFNNHRQTHSDARDKRCDTCAKTFKTTVQLHAHINTHAKPFACNECARKFSSLYAVREHMKSHARVHTTLKHTCVECGATYARQFALKEHVKEQHAKCSE